VLFLTRVILSKKEEDVMKRWKTKWVGLTCLAFLIFVAGCSGKSHPNVTLPSGVYSRHLLVLPFHAVHSNGTIVTCPICGKNNPAGPVSPEAEGVLTDMLVTGLQRRGFDVIPMSKVAGEIIKMGRKKATSNLVATAKHLAKKFNVKLVVSGIVFEYKTREGGSLGVEKPAAVSFSLHLIEGSDGRILWADRYYEVQKPLSEDASNIGRFLKRRGKWVTARRLAYDGLNNLLDHFPEMQ